jgi:hypothetical protein
MRALALPPPQQRSVLVTAEGEQPQGEEVVLYFGIIDILQVRLLSCAVLLRECAVSCGRMCFFRAVRLTHCRFGGSCLSYLVVSCYIGERGGAVLWHQRHTAGAAAVMCCAAALVCCQLREDVFLSHSTSYIL